MDNRIYEIKKYPSNLVILSHRDDDYSIFKLDYDNQQGVFTRKEWKEELEMFNEEEQEEILDVLETTSNLDFFSKKE